MTAHRMPVSVFRRAAVAAAVAGATCLSPATASAQGLFEALFGGFRRALPPAQVYEPPAERRAPAESRGAGGGVAFCVRTCDGRYFPVSRQSGVSAEQTCNSFCPAAETRIYSGSAIDHAVARDGSRYSGLRNAYVYRDRLVPGCTCDGRSPAGLASLNVDTDPTLRQGDIVATADGLMAYRGLNRHTRTAQYTPVSAYSALSDDLRAKLSRTEVDANGPVEVGEVGDDEPLMDAQPAAADRQAQLIR